MKKIIATLVVLCMHTYNSPALARRSSDVSVISVTPDAEKIMVEIARVSNPENQDNPNYAGLLKYCLKHGHWSVFEHGFLTLEINTSLAIATQMLRHRSFFFQQFSQRYADPTALTPTAPTDESKSPFVRYKLRRQDLKNRQNSIDDITPSVQEAFQDKITVHHEASLALYKEMLDAGVAKECARMILPQDTATRLYMTGNARSWIHYIQSRTYEGAQKEHQDIAQQCKQLFAKEFPVIAKALDWNITTETEPSSPQQ